MIGMKKKKIISIVVCVIGSITLIAGLIVLILNLTKTPAIQDGEFLVSTGNFKLENDDKVIWEFKEIGKGTLTTNNHVNDYEFIWALEDGKLKIETDWLYTMENEYDYSIDQANGVLTLTNDKETYKFVRLGDEKKD